MSKIMDEVPYLEGTDINPDGSLKEHVTKGKPTIVMLQGNYCGYCTQAKPAYMQLAASTPSVSVVTVQIDGPPSDQAAGKMLTKLDPGYKGVPHYLGFDKSGKFLRAHNGGRDVASLQAFVGVL